MNMPRVALLPRIGLSTIAAGILLMADGARPSQAADAANWQEVWSTVGIYCEGCCRYSFCCSLGQPCRIWPD
jgi:hypothetical protein